MPLTVQSIADDTNLAVRQYFGTTTVDLTDATKLALFTNWIDQIHKDVMHTSVWEGQILTSDTFVSEPDGSPYIITANNIRRVVAVHDLKNRNTVIPHQDLTFPAATSSPPERSGPPRTRWNESEQTSPLWPRYYIFEACFQSADGSYVQGFHLLPDPFDTAHSGTIRYFFTKVVDTMSAAGDILFVPEDGRDIMVAGTAMMASQFLKRPSEAEMWRARYEAMKKGF